jgi:hypothetical protein
LKFVPEFAILMPFFGHFCAKRLKILPFFAKTKVQIVYQETFFCFTGNANLNQFLHKMRKVG